MKVSVSKSKVSGRITAPSSKSYTIRGVICASLAKGVSEILSPLASDDTDAAMDVMSNIGIRIEQTDGLWRVHGGNFVNLGRDLFCRES
ncbi:MAG: 3-phosphoshikimate 1-carboxyvinyltransferase, partial [Chloroflexota bacterium]